MKLNAQLEMLLAWEDIALSTMLSTADAHTEQKHKGEKKIY